MCIKHFEEKDFCRYDKFPVAGGGSVSIINSLLITLNAL